MENFKINVNYLMIFFLILFKYLINYGVNEIIMYAVLLCVSFILFIYILKKRNLNKKSFNKMFLFFLLSTVYVFAYKDVNLLISLILALSYPKNDEKSFLKIFFISSILMYGLTIALSYFGVIENKLMIRYSSSGISYRNSIGFTHPNEVFLYFLPIALTSICIFENKRLTLIIIFVISSILYLISLSRTGFISLLLLYLFYFISSKKLKRISFFILIFLILLSFIIPLLYGSNVNNFVNTILSKRPFYWYDVMSNYSPFTLFGIGQVENTYLDNSYLFLVYRLGIYGALTYLYIFLKGFKTLKNKNLLVALLVFLVYGFTEGNLIIGSINFIIAIMIHNIIFINKEDDNYESEHNNTSL